MNFKHLFIGVVSWVFTSVAIAGLSGSLNEDAIAERLTPEAKVIVSGVDPNAKAAKKSTGPGGPDQIYKKNCATCHKTGLAGAPMTGSAADWVDRQKKGIDQLTYNAYHGINAMPPKGNCIKCTEDDIRATVQYMLDAL